MNIPSRLEILDKTYADWAELPHDMLELIVKNINLIEDFSRFRSVCRSWRKIAPSNKKNLRPQIPWLILPDKPPGDDHRQIYSLSKDDIIFKNLYIPEMSDRRCIGLHYGWVLTVTRLHGEINLIHPISRLQIELPPQTSINRYKDIMPPASYNFIKSSALSGNPSESSDLIVMVVDYLDAVYYWRRGSKHWIEINRHDCICNVTYYQDRFYSVSYNSDVWGYKVDRDDSIVAYKINTTKCPVARHNCPYIVGSTRGLLLVARENCFEKNLEEEDEDNDGVGEGEGDDDNDGVGVGEGDDDNEVEEGEGEEDDDEEDVPEKELEEDGYTNRYRLVNFHVFEFDLTNGGYKQTKSLGDRAIFVGHNTSISMDCASDYPGIKSNHIYFTDDRVEEYLFLLKGGGRDMGVYSLKDAQIMPFKIEESSTRSRISPPFWFF